MAKDDFKFTLSFGEDVFGGPRWCDLVAPEDAARYRASHTIPVMTDADGRPILRNLQLSFARPLHHELLDIDEQFSLGGYHLDVEDDGVSTLRILTTHQTNYCGLQSSMNGHALVRHWHVERVRRVIPVDER